MFKVLADQEFSRRKRFHHVIDEEGNVKASFANMCDVFDWLYENGHVKFELKTEEATYSIDINSRWE